MLGAIVGDVVGSTREFHPIKTKAFDLRIGQVREDGRVRGRKACEPLDGWRENVDVRREAREFLRTELDEPHGRSFGVGRLPASGLQRDPPRLGVGAVAQPAHGPGVEDEPDAVRSLGRLPPQAVRRIDLDGEE